MRTNLIDSQYDGNPNVATNNCKINILDSSNHLIPGILA